MERILIVMLVLFSCNGNTTEEATIEQLKNISNSNIYFDYDVNSITLEFIESNHVDSDCSNALIKKMFSLISFFDSVGDKLVHDSGGIDENGALLSVSNSSFSTQIIEKTELFNVVKSSLEEMNLISQRDSLPFNDLVLGKVQKDVKVFSFYYWEKQQGLTVGQVYNDLIAAKASLMFTEMMYFEMLKSEGFCQSSTIAEMSNPNFN